MNIDGSKLVSVNKYCAENEIDLYDFLSLIRKAKVIILKIGNTYFVQNQVDLDLTLQKRFEELESSREKRKLRAIELAAARKVETNLRKKLMEVGLTPDQIADLSSSDGELEGLYNFLSKDKSASFSKDKSASSKDSVLYSFEDPAKEDKGEES